MIADYPFPIDNIVRVQADTNTEFEASQRVPERVGFRKEGIIRRHFFTRGK
jgi:RimJ/RimL family protein N-acetyltransferase